ncbi:TorF family putative porin [Thiomicrorhabdus sp.]|uniref:TorF family putative porin n=1 Tax=Thiomicrorhabdus sp. TaxID=2039724 RepID=UPI003569ECCC
MKKTFQLKNLVLSMAVAGAAAVSLAPAAAHAEMSYNASVSNMYLWRGINISDPSPVVSGGMDYDFGNGFAVGTWASSEGSFDNSSELDLYGSYSISMGDFGLSLGYNAYLYPTASKEMFKSAYDSDGDGSMLSDYVVGLSYKDLSATAFINTERDKSDNNVYVSLDYSIGAFGLHAAKNFNDVSGAEYTDFNVSYAATDALTFTLSKASGDGAIATVAGIKGTDGTEAENVQLQVSYALPI